MKQAGHFIFLALMLFVCQAATGQHTTQDRFKRYPVRTINFENGLVNNGTTGIITDKLGFTWVSTKTGLQRYNGYLLQTIMPVIGRDTFNINQPVYFFALNNGLLWISFRQTVLQYDPVSDLFSVVISLSSAGNSFFSIVPLKETKEGIWCMQEKKGIVLYSKQGKLLNQFSLFEPSMIDGILYSQEFLYFNKITTNDNYIFISKSGTNSNYASLNTNEGIVLAINTATKESRQIDIQESILSLTCSQERLYVLTAKNLYSISVAKYDGIRKRKLDRSGNEYINIRSGIIYLQGDNLLLALNNRLYEYDTAGFYRSDITNLDRTPVLQTGFIHQIYPDFFKRIWLLTNNDIKRIEDVKIPFTHFIYPDEKTNFIRTLYYDEQAKILLAGSFYGGVQLYDTMANALWKEPLTTEAVRNVIGIEKLAPNQYLVISFANGWYLLDLAAKTLKPFSIPKDIGSLMQPNLVNFSNNIQRVNSNTLFVSTANNVFRCELTAAGLRSATLLLPDKKFSGIVDCFLYDSRKNLWVGTVDGTLYRVDQNGTQQSISVPNMYAVRSMAEDIKNNIWVGTERGLYVYSRDGHLLKGITRETGLKNDCIYAILPADTGAAVFASSNLGISHISLTGDIQNFSKEMGLQDNEFNTGSACKTAGGKFYFGGINGVTAFYPGSLLAINDSPFLYITKLVVNDSLYNSSAGSWRSDTILLKYNQNRLRFDMAAIGLLNTNEYVYRYRMKNFEESWQTTYQPTGINYTLEPGKYSLEITCSPILSSETSFYKKFVITIYPPWWQTWWFRISAIVFITGIIVLIVQQYNRRKYIKKIRALQTQNEIQHERERISRDLHDNIGVQANALLYGTEQLQKLAPETALVDNLQSTARDMMQSLRETVWVMRDNNAKASDIWVRIISFCKQLGLIYKEIKISVEGEAPENIVLNSTKTLHIVLIIQEAINNAVRHAKAKKIIVESKKEEKGWMIIIGDNGYGFNQETDGKLSGGGFGLSNMKERASMAGIGLTLNSQLEKGTNVVLFIPFKD